MIDASLYAAFAPRQKGALDYAQEFAGLDASRQAQQAGALNQRFGQAKFDEYQRGVQKATALEQLMGSMAGKSDTEVLAGLRGAGRFTEAGAMEGGMLDRQKKATDIRKDSATAGKTEQETKEAKKKQAILDIAVLPDFDGARASISGKVQSGELPMQMAQGIMQSMPQDPAQFATWKNNLILKMAAPEAQLSAQTQTRGQDVSAATAAAGQQVTAQHNAATEATARGHLGVAQGQLALSRSREGREAQAPRGILQETEQGLMLVDPRAGTAVPVTAGGEPLQGKSANKPLAPAALKTLTEARDNASTMTALSSSFKDDYASKGVLGMGADLSLQAKGVLGSDKDSVEWWKNYRKQSELVERHALFGAALTPTEQASWRGADVGPGMDPKVIKRNLETRARLAKEVLRGTQQDLIDAGAPAGRVNPIASRKGAAEAAAEPPAVSGPYTDAAKEQRYQEWKRSQGQR